MYRGWPVVFRKLPSAVRSRVLQLIRYVNVCRRYQFVLMLSLSLMLCVKVLLEGCKILGPGVKI